MSEHAVEAVERAFQVTRDELLGRLRGLSDDEYLWEPVPGCWTINPTDGGWTAHHDHEADPPPVTTIAWRMWHLAIDCFESYSHRAFGERATGLPDDRFVGTALEATAILRRSVDHFLAGFVALGPDAARPIGPDFGPFAERDHVDLALHALRELNHHGAEIGLLRDLWANRPTD